jgi:hypothetical protein
MNNPFAKYNDIIDASDMYDKLMSLLSSPCLAIHKTLLGGGNESQKLIVLDHLFNMNYLLENKYFKMYFEKHIDLFRFRKEKKTEEKIKELELQNQLLICQFEKLCSMKDIDKSDMKLVLGYDTRTIQANHREDDLKHKKNKVATFL